MDILDILSYQIYGGQGKKEFFFFFPMHLLANQAALSGTHENKQS